MIARKRLSERARCVSEGMDASLDQSCQMHMNCAANLQEGRNHFWVRPTSAAISKIPCSSSQGNENSRAIQHNFDFEEEKGMVQL
jgi:hypothetical protein